MKYTFHFHDRPDADQILELEDLPQARLMAMRTLLDVSRDEARHVPFHLALSVSDNTGAELFKLDLALQARNPA
jgi:hypothetical protein